MHEDSADAGLILRQKWSRKQVQRQGTREEYVPGKVESSTILRRYRSEAMRARAAPMHDAIGHAAAKDRVSSIGNWVNRDDRH